ncbi:TolB-like protein [Pseudomonas nitritireducens]|uniref:TolB-like protein n=1 Tax=Pseudomonas nitroreducens TaxID=46680 RepID=A0A7W7KPG7_PSENT|nr:FlgO family outer membrane protein [Pseudomonas nitritireducens]MBB4866281.1 TolB-like protein [Pseudomonas nitritireducens]
MPQPGFAFGDFLLDSRAGTLTRNGAPVALGYRALQLLAALLERAGDAVPKAELLEAAWPGLVVEEGNLTVQIAQLRKALGPAPDGGQWIATLPRLGYRFSAPVRRIAEQESAALALPEQPSIAVLPFVNLSDDPQQAFFADGLSEDLTTELSRAGGLFVIARTSAFAYRGKAMDVRQIARELGVRYLLEGSARRVDARVRVNAKLLDASTGEHVWAERFESRVEDLFDLQDQLSAKILQALLGHLRTPLPRNRPNNLEAYELCVRARQLMDDSPLAAQEAHLLLSRAIALDPQYAEARRWLAMNHWMGWIHSGGPTPVERETALAQAREAVAIDPNDAGSRWSLAYLLTYERQYAEADAQFQRALELDPNDADAWTALSDVSVLAGRIDEGLEYIRRALRLNPFPAGWYYLTLGQAQYAARDYQGAIHTLRREETYRSSSRRFLAASLAQLGRLDEARAETELFLVGNPHFTIRHWLATEPLRDAAVRAHFVEGFRLAGLPA